MSGVEADGVITIGIALDLANVGQRDGALVSIVGGAPRKRIGCMISSRAGKKTWEHERDERAKRWDA